MLDYHERTHANDDIAALCSFFEGVFKTISICITGRIYPTPLFNHIISSVILCLFVINNLTLLFIPVTELCQHVMLL